MKPQINNALDKTNEFLTRFYELLGCEQPKQSRGIYDFVADYEASASNTKARKPHTQRTAVAPGDARPPPAALTAA